ncbi:hypothetical protein Nmel_016344 [Mimus melanotis]
MRPLSSLRPSA